MSMLRLPDQKALDDLVARSHVRVVKGKNAEDVDERFKTRPKPEAKVPKIAVIPRPPSRLEQQMALQVMTSKVLPPPIRGYRYLDYRRFTGDCVWAHIKLALEIDGGAHKTEKRFAASFERAYLLQRAGWLVLHVGPREVKNGMALEWIETLYRHRVTKEG